MRETRPELVRTRRAVHMVFVSLLVATGCDRGGCSADSSGGGAGSRPPVAAGTGAAAGSAGLATNDAGAASTLLVLTDASLGAPAALVDGPDCGARQRLRGAGAGSWRPPDRVRERGRRRVLRERLSARRDRARERAARRDLLGGAPRCAGGRRRGARPLHRAALTRRVRLDEQAGARARCPQTASTSCTTPPERETSARYHSAAFAPYPVSAFVPQMTDSVRLACRAPLACSHRVAVDRAPRSARDRRRRSAPLRRARAAR